MLQLIKNQPSLPQPPARPMHGLVQRLSLGVHIHSPRIIAFIAARSREGTSTVAYNYALTLGGETGKKVLLIDAGILSFKRFQSYGVDASLGIVEATMGQKALGEAIHAIGQGVFICRWTGSDDNRSAAARLMHDDDFWQKLLQTYDFIVIDLPSLQSSFDGITFATKADAVVMVVESEKTPEPVVVNLRDTLVETGAKMAGVVMNKRRFYIPNRVYKRL